MLGLAPKPPQLPWPMRGVNIFLCIVGAIFVFGYLRRYHFLFPITFESIWQISLAEVNRRKSKRRVELLHAEPNPGDVEKGSSRTKAPTRCIASVVGYREEPGLFRKALESYRGSPGLEIMLVGIDGNQEEDMHMVHIAQNVFPDNTLTLSLSEPLGRLAERLTAEYVTRKYGESREAKGSGTAPLEDLKDVSSQDREEAQKYAMQMVYDKVVNLLRQHHALESSGRNSFRAICIYQPHVCKKDIMFTTMIFSLALGHANDIDFLWASDSDTWITRDTLSLTIGCMAPDPLIGGSCTTLSVHNENDSVIAALGSAAYWSELAITRGQSSAVDAVDCQPGPCAAFRLAALEPMIYSWYTQTSLGIRTVVNEDRHLTTQLLLAGWKVTYITQAIAYTDTPTTLLRWLLQQIRWARATHIETFQYPAVYSIHSPILFITAMRRFYGPLSIGVFVIRYVLRGDVVRAYSPVDLLCRVLLCTAYNFICNQEHVSSWTYLALSQFFYQLPLPGIIAWSTLTALESGWGTKMRNRKEALKGASAGWDNLGAITAVLVWMGFVAAGLTRFAVGRLLPGWEMVFMWLAAGGTMAGLYHALLGRGSLV